MPPIDPTGAVVRNLFDLQQLGNGITADVRELLIELFDEIVAEIAKSDLSGVEGVVWDRGAVKDLLDRIEAKTGEAFTEIQKTVRAQTAQVGNQQAKWAQAMLKKSIGDVPDVSIAAGDITTNLAKQILDNNPLLGDVMGDTFSKMSENVVRRVRVQIQQGMANGETIDEMVHRIRGSAISGSPGDYFGGVLDTTTREATGVVLTAVNDISNIAHMSTWQANDDVVKGWRFVTALDFRVCLICAPLDGTIYPLDDTTFQPPLHWNDRCISVPVIDWAGLGLDAPAAGKRASVDGPVSSHTFYESWLGDQTAEAQDEMLGPARGDLFRAGKVTLSDLVRHDGRIVRVADLN